MPCIKTVGHCIILYALFDPLFNIITLFFVAFLLVAFIAPCQLECLFCPLHWKRVKYVIFNECNSNIIYQLHPHLTTLEYILLSESWFCLYVVYIKSNYTSCWMLPSDIKNKLFVFFCPKLLRKICLGHRFCKGHLDTDLEDYEAVTAATVDPDDD